MLGWIYDEDTRNPGYFWDRDKAISGYTQLIKNYLNSQYAQKAAERIDILAK